MAFSSSLAQVSSASTAPVVSSGHSEKDMLAELVISLTATPSTSGRPWPPKLEGRVTPFQPDSQNCL
jgi:hypothetical protein